MDKKKAEYQVIARKYRPQTFADVVGQETIVTTLKNALRFQRLAHAYLFCGCRGTGKTTLARLFAKALNCQKPTADLEPCNQCPSCLEVMSGRSLDVLEIDGASNRGIDDIRQLNETIGYAPSSGKFKIYIIDEVHMLTKEAFNALLKTLEEPPASVKFFFATTEPHKVLPTIISRCQRFDLGRISFDALQGKLAWITQDLNIQCEPEALALITQMGEGSLRDAQSLLDQVICYADEPITAEKVALTLGLMPRSTFLKLDQAVKAQNLSYVFELVQTIFSSGKDLSHFLDNLIEHFRSLLHLKHGQTLPFLSDKEKSQYQESAKFYTEEHCLYILDYLIQWQQQILKTPFKRVGLEMILIHLIRSKNRIPLPALVKRLMELEEHVGKSAPAEQQQEIASSSFEEKKTEASLAKEIAPQNEAHTEKTVPVEIPVQETTLAPLTEKIEKVTAISEAPQKPAAKKAVKTPPVEKEVPVQKVEEPATEQLEALTQLSIELTSPKIDFPAQEMIQPAIKIEVEVSLPAKPSLEESLLKKIKEKIERSESPIPSAKIIEEPKPVLIEEKAEEPIVKEEKPTVLETQSVTQPSVHPSRYDTLIRFAAVELEGTIKKE